MKASKFAWWFAQIFGFIGGVSLIRGLMHGGVINYVAANSDNNCNTHGA